MPVWSFTTDPFERELIFRSSYIKEAKCQQKYFDSSLVNPYEKVIPFFCFSLNHRRKALCNLPHLTLSFRHFKTASRGKLSGKSETVVAALRWLWFVYCITTESAACCFRATNNTMALLCVWLTLAKGEKQVAQLFSSRKWDDIHFMSDGISSNLNTTCSPLSEVSVFPSICSISSLKWFG